MEQRNQRYFFEQICELFEHHGQLSMFQDGIRSYIENGDENCDSSKNADETNESRLSFELIRTAVQTIHMELSEHDKELLSCGDPLDLRERIMFMHGYNAAEAGKLFPHMPHIFHRGGVKKKPPKLAFDDAAAVSAFLEVPPNLLVDRRFPLEMLCARPLTPWYFETSVKDMTLDDFAGVDPVDTSIYLMEYGRVLLPDLHFPVGIVVIRTPEYTEIAITTNQHVHVSRSRWDYRLLDIAEELAIFGSCVYSVASPYLDSSDTRIYRMSFPRFKSPRTRFKVYSKVLSPRTGEVTFYKGSHEHTVKFPTQRRAKVISGMQIGVWEGLSEACGKRSRVKKQDTKYLTI